MKREEGEEEEKKREEEKKEREREEVERSSCKVYVIKRRSGINVQFLRTRQDSATSGIILGLENTQ